jgi:hypothetical protein
VATALLELVRARAELEAALSAKVAEGDEAAKATMAAVERLFARAACQDRPQKP